MTQAVARVCSKKQSHPPVYSRPGYNGQLRSLASSEGLLEHHGKDTGRQIDLDDCGCSNSKPFSFTRARVVLPPMPKANISCSPRRWVEGTPLLRVVKTSHSTPPPESNK